LIQHVQSCARVADTGDRAASGGEKSSLFTKAQKDILRALNEWFARVNPKPAYLTNADRSATFQAWKNWSAAIAIITNETRVFLDIQSRGVTSVDTAGKFLEMAVKCATLAAFFGGKKPRKFSDMKGLGAPPVIILFVYNVFAHQKQSTTKEAFFSSPEYIWDLLSDDDSKVAAFEAISTSQRPAVDALINALDVVQSDPETSRVAETVSRPVSRPGSRRVSTSSIPEVVPEGGSAAAAAGMWSGFIKEQGVILEAIKSWYDGLSENSAMRTKIPTDDLTNADSEIFRARDALSEFVSSGTTTAKPFGVDDYGNKRSCWQTIEVFVQDLVEWCKSTRNTTTLPYARLDSCKVPRVVIFFAEKCVAACKTSLFDFPRVVDSDMTFLTDAEAATAVLYAEDASSARGITKRLADLEAPPSV